MHIAILGAGNVGGTLGRRWATLGHTVTFGVRAPERGAAAVKGGANAGEPLPSGASVTAPSDVLMGPDGRADALLLATPWGAVPETLHALQRELGDGALDGLPLLDATNPLGAGFRFDVAAGFDSGAAQVQSLVPGAHVVKVFNTTGFDNMRNPIYGGNASMMLYAGDSASAKGVAHELAAVLGFDAVDAGSLVRARELEHLAMLWISMAMGAGGSERMGRDIAFRLLRR